MFNANFDVHFAGWKTFLKVQHFKKTAFLLYVLLLIYCNSYPLIPRFWKFSSKVSRHSTKTSYSRCTKWRVNSFSDFTGKSIGRCSYILYSPSANLMEMQYLRSLVEVSALKDNVLVTNSLREINQSKDQINGRIIKVIFPESATDNKDSDSLFGLVPFSFTIMLLKEDNNIDRNRLLRLLNMLSKEGKDNNELDYAVSSIHVGRSHFLSLTYPDLTNYRHLLPTLRIGIDAWELRVDLLQDQSASNIHRQIAILRSFDPTIPIVYTVRTREQFGQFPDHAHTEILNLLREGLQANVEWLDIEASLPTDVLVKILADIKSPSRKSDSFGVDSFQYPTKIIGSFHTRTSVSELSDSIILSLFKTCLLTRSNEENARFSKVSIVKVVTGEPAHKPEESLRIHTLGAQFVDVYNTATAASAEKRNPLMYIGLCLGLKGQLSRIYNTCFTPVTHPLLTTPAAPGQLSVAQLYSLRSKAQENRDQEFDHSSFANSTKEKRYFLFGENISYSLSPAMHQAAFHALHLPHCQYSLWDTSNILNYLPYIRQNASFGGASVTIPYKEHIIPFLDGLSEAAAMIGAVNTIVPTTLREIRDSSSLINLERKINIDEIDPEKLSLIGHNTDWLGIFRPLSQLLRLLRPSSSCVSASSSPLSCQLDFDTDSSKFTGGYYAYSSDVDGDNNGELNTNGNGMKTSISSSESSDTNSKQRQQGQQIGVVLGAGGTARAACYAIRQLGLQLVVVNRNITKAQELADRFGGTVLPLDHFNQSNYNPHLFSAINNKETLHNNFNASQVAVIISTLPGSVISSLSLVLPSELLRIAQPIVFDVVYTPALTPLLLQARAAGCPTIQGASMLLTQGIAQFELWQQRPAPVQAMQQALFSHTAAAADDDDTTTRSNEGIVTYTATAVVDRRVPKIDSIIF